MTAAAVLDPAAIDALYDIGEGDESFVRDVVASYVEQSREQMIAIRAAVAAKNRHGAARAAHSLAGASLNVGASSVVQVYRRIEASASPASEDVRELEAQLARVCADPLAQS